MDAQAGDTRHHPHQDQLPRIRHGRAPLRGRQVMLRETDMYGRHSALGGPDTVDVFVLIGDAGLHPSYVSADYVGAHRADDDATGTMLREWSAL